MTLRAYDVRVNMGLRWVVVVGGLVFLAAAFLVIIFRVRYANWQQAQYERTAVFFKPAKFTPRAALVLGTGYLAFGVALDLIGILQN